MVLKIAADYYIKLLSGIIRDMASNADPSPSWRFLPALLLLFVLAGCMQAPAIPTPVAIQNAPTAEPMQIPTRATRTPTSTIAPSPTQPWLPTLAVIGAENLDNLQMLHSLPAYTSALAISPDSAWLATGSLERDVQIWNLANGAFFSAETGGNPGTLWALAFSPDSRQLAMGSGDALVRLWDVPSFTLTATLDAHLYDVRSLDFSPDGLTLASGSNDQTIRLWDLASGEASTLQWNPGYVRAVQYAPDGSRLASASGDGALRLWDAQGRLLYDLRLWDTQAELLPEVRLNQDDMTSLAISPDGNLLAAGATNRFLWVFTLPEFRRLAAIQAHEADINAVAFSPDGSILASGSEDGTVKFWRVNPGAETALEALYTLSPRPGYRVSALCFSADGTLLVTAALNADVMVWGVDANRSAE